MNFQHQTKPHTPRPLQIFERAGPIFQKYKELSKFPAPSQNPDGLREIDKRAIEFTKFMLDSIQGCMGINIVNTFDASKVKAKSASEDGFLLSAVMSPPTYLDWASGLNNTEKRYKNNKSDRLIATFQHFCMMLQVISHGVEIHLIKPIPAALESVFTRDPLFVIDDEVFLANMVRPERQPEESLVSGGIKPPKEVKIEGGNVILDKDRIFLGIGDRTFQNAVEWLQSELGTTREVIPLKTKEGVLHLDCAFCPLESQNGNGNAALVYAGAFSDKKDLELLSKVYGRLETVSKTEYKLLGLNVLKLDKFAEIVNQGAVSVIQAINSYGVQTIPLDYSELVKAEGAYRCTYAAISRQN